PQDAVAARCGSRRRAGQAVPRRRDPDRDVLYGAAPVWPGRAVRIRTARGQAPERVPAPAAGAPGLGAGRNRRVLEDLPARGLRDLALPISNVRADERDDARLHLPLPLLDVPARGGWPPDLRPGRARAAPAAADGRRAGLP